MIPKVETSHLKNSELKINSKIFFACNREISPKALSPQIKFSLMISRGEIHKILLTFHTHTREKYCTSDMISYLICVCLSGVNRSFIRVMLASWLAVPFDVAFTNWANKNYVQKRLFFALLFLSISHFGWQIRGWHNFLIEE